MESNTPPNTNQTSPDNILSPPFHRRNPSNVSVVSQSQSTTRSLSQDSYTGDYQLKRLIDDAVHHNFAAQTPMREISSVAPVATPIHSTPTKKQCTESANSKLFTINPIAQSVALKKREDLMATYAKQVQKFGNPQNVILCWLRANRLSVQRSITPKKPLNLTHRYKSILLAWYNEKTENRFDYKPFQALKSSLINSGLSPLTPRHRRMLLEDIILLLPGTMVVCLISPKHPFFSGIGSVAFTNKMELALQNDPLMITIGKGIAKAGNQRRALQ